MAARAGRADTRPRRTTPRANAPLAVHASRRTIGGIGKMEENVLPAIL